MRIVIIDSFALIHRVYHALPYFTDKDGKPAGAVYGFCSLVLKIYKDLKPDKILAAFDLPVPTFRQELFPSYQAHRPEKKEDFAPQVERIKEFLKIARVPVLSSPGFEGDDVIGSLVAQLVKNKQDEIVILTGDSDTLQLTSDRVKVFTMKKGISDLIVYDAAAAKEKLGFDPQLLPDYKALAGDASDGIPGVAGVGPKTATLLIQKFGTLERLYEFLEKNQDQAIEKPLSGKLVQKLRAEKKQAFLCRQLGTIRQDVKLETNLLAQQLDFTSPELAEFLEQQGFYSLLKRLKLKSSAEPSLALGFSPKPATVAHLIQAAWSKVQQEISSQQTLFWFLSDAQELAVSGGQSWCRLTAANQFVELARLFSDQQIVKTGWQLKLLLKQHLHLQQELENVWDLEIIAWLLDPDSKKYELQQLAARYLSAKPVGVNELSPERALELTRELGQVLKDKLREENLERVYRTIELPLVPVLVHLEESGILLDLARLKAVQRELASKGTELAERIFKLAGRRFNLNSTRELATVLYQELKLGPSPGARIKKLKSGYFSTDAEQLSKISSQHPVVELILSWKELAKLNSTYAQALTEHVSPKTGRVHATFIQTGTATGRLASAAPNLQNIPKHSAEAGLIRSAFKSAPGWSLLAFDYSQIELRLVASLSEDENLLKAFRENQDIHQVTASLVWGVPLAQVDRELRFRAKALNFGILYGMGARSLAQTAKISLSEAREFIAAYFNKFTAVKRYISGVLEFLKANGYVETLWGRRRYFPEYFSGSSHLVSQAERMALNLTLQGLAADIIKTAMIRIYSQLILPQPAKLKLICQVHDELLFEAKDEIIEEIKGKIQSILEGVYQDKVSLVAHCHQGKYWSELD